MTLDEIRKHVLKTLADIAPEADLSALKSNVSLREQLDIDSMDFLNFAIAIHKDLNVEIPERDYPKLLTLDGCVNYLTSAVAVQQVK